MLVLAGYLIVHFFEHAITPHFHYGEETHADEFVHSHKRMSVLVGPMIHTFFDGIAITSGFLISSWLGWVIFLAVFLHKIPEGFTVTSVMLASGLSKGKSWFASVMLGLATLAGVLTMAIGKHAVSYGLPVAAGVTIYVAASDLIPEVNQEPGVKMALVVFVGVDALFLLDRLVRIDRTCRYHMCYQKGDYGSPTTSCVDGAGRGLFDAEFEFRQASPHKFECR